MEYTDEEKFERLDEFYEQGNDEFFFKEWRSFPSQLRLNLILRAYRDNRRSLISPEHFDIHREDLRIIEDAICQYGESFGLSKERIQELYFGFRGRSMSTDSLQYKNILNAIGFADRMREYDKLLKKHNLSPELISVTPDILKCDSRRTDSRIQYLKEQDEGYLKNSANFGFYLSMRSDRFMQVFEKNLIRTMSSLKPDSDIYRVTMLLDEVVPIEENAKFVELFLRAYYKDPTIEKEISRRVPQIREQPKNNSESKPGQAENSSKTDRKLEFIKVEELFTDVLPKSENDKNGSGIPPTVSKPNERERLDSEVINVYLNILKLHGIQCMGKVTSNSGVHAIGEDDLSYYVFSKDSEEAKGYVVFEPIGQVGNRTLILKGMETKEMLEEVLRINTSKDLVRKRIGTRINHTRTNEQRYMYEPLRIANCFTIIEEVSREPHPTQSIESIQEGITKMIPQSEIQNVSKYIANLSKKFPQIMIFGGSLRPTQERKIKEFVNSKPESTEDKKGVQAEEVEF